MEAVYLALIVAVPAFLSPLFLAWLTNRNLRKVKEQDWARQDVVAAKAERTAELLRKNNLAVALATAETQKQLKIIHTLVNSTLTAALQGRVDAVRKAIGLMHRIIELNKGIGIEPTIAALAEIEASEKEVADLELNITDRLRQSKEAVIEAAKL